MVIGGEVYAVLSQRIQIRGLRNGVILESQLLGAMIVAQDVNDIGFGIHCVHSFVVNAMPGSAAENTHAGRASVRAAYLPAVENSLQAFT